MYTVVMSSVEMSTSHIWMPKFLELANWPIQLMHTIRGSRWCLKYMGPWHSYRVPGLNVQFLVPSWPSLKLLWSSGEWTTRQKFSSFSQGKDTHTGDLHWALRSHCGIWGVSWQMGALVCICLHSLSPFLIKKKFQRKEGREKNKNPSK